MFLVCPYVHNDAVHCLCENALILLPEFSVCNPGALFRNSMLLDRDFLNSAPGLYTENSSTFNFYE